MDSLHVLPLQVPSFALLVKRMRKHLKDADVFELWLDDMKVKGDLAVIRHHFGRPMLGKSDHLDMLKRAAKSGFDYVDAADDLELDEDFTTLINNKGTILIRSHHDFETTPSKEALLAKLKEMDESGGQLLKIACTNDTEEETDRLLSLLDLPEYKDRLIIAGMGKDAKRIRIEAPLRGSKFYFAPILKKHASAPGQLTKEELEQAWGFTKLES